MKRQLILLLLVLLAILALSGCGCKHEWQDATCSEAKSCRICGERRGVALGHSWADAVCGAPKTCTVCGKTEGEALEHNWVKPTCTKGYSCTVCGTTEGEPLGHSWVDATCTTPRTCSVCGIVDGSDTGHSWLDATCTEPKTCIICAVTEGDPLGHSWTKPTCTAPQSCLLCGLWGTAALGHEWQDATCEEPVHCAYCDATQGDPLGHSWIDATPEAPKTCAVCSATEGDPIFVDDRFVAEDCVMLMGSWRYKLVYTAADLNVPGFDEEIVEYVTYTFGDYGILTITSEIADVETYKKMMAASMVESYYAAQAEEGRNAEEADAFWMKEHNMTISAYAAYMVSSITAEDLNLREERVYYVVDGLLYTAEFWEDDMTTMTFMIDGDKMTLTDDFLQETFLCDRVSGIGA